MTYLSVSYECWNCDNKAPCHENSSSFKFVVYENITDLDKNWHPVCEPCMLRLAVECGMQVFVTTAP